MVHIHSAVSDNLTLIFYVIYKGIVFKPSIVSMVVLKLIFPIKFALSDASYWRKVSDKSL